MTRILICLGIISVGALALYMVFGRKKRAEIYSMKPCIVSNSLAVHQVLQANSFTIKSPEPQGKTIEVLRTITKRSIGKRVFKVRILGVDKMIPVPWPELKTWNEWQKVELVEDRPRSVVVRYPDGGEAVVKRARTR